MWFLTSMISISGLLFGLDTVSARLPRYKEEQGTEASWAAGSNLLVHPLWTCKDTV
jgi:hypothetical protein